MKAQRLPTLSALTTTAAALALVLAGCSEVEQTLNKGGDTPCNEYMAQDAHKQRVTITKALQQRSGKNYEPSGTEVDAAIVSVRLLCSVQSNNKALIKNADLTGILVPR